MWKAESLSGVFGQHFHHQDLAVTVMVIVMSEGVCDFWFREVVVARRPLRSSHLD